MNIIIFYGFVYCVNFVPNINAIYDKTSSFCFQFFCFVFCVLLILILICFLLLLGFLHRKSSESSVTAHIGNTNIVLLEGLPPVIK